MSLTRSGFRLFRVDDRLLHGQVSMGWGRHLEPKHYLLADDALAADASSAAIYELSAPEDTQVSILAVEVLLSEWRLRSERDSTVLLVRGIAEAAELLRGGIEGPVNLGGLHQREGADPFLPFLYLTKDEAALVETLVREGHALFVQDLPENPRRDIELLLEEGPDPERA